MSQHLNTEHRDSVIKKKEENCNNGSLEIMDNLLLMSLEARFSPKHFERDVNL